MCVRELLFYVLASRVSYLAFDFLPAEWKMLPQCSLIFISLEWSWPCFLMLKGHFHPFLWVVFSCVLHVLFLKILTPHPTPIKSSLYSRDIRSLSVLYDANISFQFLTCLLTSSVFGFFCHIKVYFCVVRFINLLLLLEFLVKIRKSLPILRLYESSYFFLVSALFFYIRLSNSVLAVSHQASLSMGFFWARILERVAISSFGGSSRPKDGTHISCFGRQILYPWATWEAYELYAPWKILLEFLSGLL